MVVMVTERVMETASLQLMMTKRQLRTVMVMVMVMVMN
jgi:hypothetical protein